MKIRKGDMVKVIAGREKGKTGKVIRIDHQKGRVWVEKLCFVKRHQRPTQRYRQGGVIEKEAPINISNVMFYDDKVGKTTRVGYRWLEDRKVRFSKRSGEVI